MTSTTCSPSRSMLCCLCLALAAGVLGGTSAGCSATTTHYYALSQVDAAAATRARSASGPAVIGVGPVSLPDYVDRPQIVTRTGANTLEQAAFDQWGGSLDDMIPRVLVEDLAACLPGDHVVSFPQVSDVPFDYRVPISISQFDVSSAGEAVVVARWQIRGKQGAAAVLMRETVARAQATGKSYGEMVAALSRALGDLTSDVASQLASLPRSKAATAAVPAASARH